MITPIGHGYTQNLHYKTPALISLVKPQTRTIHIRNHLRRIDFPPCLAILDYARHQIKKTYLMEEFALLGIKELNQDPLLYPLPLPNHFRSGKVCLGDHAPKQHPILTTLNHQILDHYFQSTFTQYEDEFHIPVEIKLLPETIQQDAITQYNHQPGIKSYRLSELLTHFSLKIP